MNSVTVLTIEDFVAATRCRVIQKITFRKQAWKLVDAHYSRTSYTWSGSSGGLMRIFRTPDGYEVRIMHRTSMTVEEHVVIAVHRRDGARLEYQTVVESDRRNIGEAA